MQNTANLIGLVKAASRMVNVTPAQKRALTRGYASSDMTNQVRKQNGMQQQAPRAVYSSNTAQAQQQAQQFALRNPNANVQAGGKTVQQGVAPQQQQQRVVNRGTAARDRAALGNNYATRRNASGRSWGYKSQGGLDSASNTALEREQRYQNKTYGANLVNKVNYAANTLGSNVNSSLKENAGETYRRAGDYMTHGAVSHNNQRKVAQGIFNAFDSRAGITKQWDGQGNFYDLDQAEQARYGLNEQERALYNQARGILGVDVAGANSMAQYNDYRDPRQNFDVGVQQTIGYNPYMH